MVAHGADHDMSAMASTGHAHGSDATSSGGMQMTFLTATNTPLYSNSWTPASAGAYAGTCVFLILLAVTLRALFTAKSFLEARAIESALKRRYVVVADQPSVTDKAMNDASSTTGILTTNGVQEDVKVVSAPVKHIQPWRFGVDLPRALLMTVATAVGYLLMLAVMTYNVGYFCSVLAGAFIGELAFGRFGHGAMSM
ncbi:Ctr copper transporter-like protein [Massariosphaeria phaeospora]|uniref:Copper transport protein n=1 Tax=Massariosphaeria phaeospora TaxID=100035 RepID=A0A7C8I8G3_9PLEO|nr:Ctr copper transporter-like protein [Massariosphaeria phaeospora]